MPFTAVCPHCRDAKFRAPWRKIDTPHTCSKCGHEFHLFPDDTPPTLAVPSGTVAVVPRTAGPAVAPAPDPTYQPTREHREPTDTPTVLALFGVGLFGVAVVASQFPYGRFVAVGLAVVGLLLAGLSLLGLEVWRRVGWAGVGLNAFALLLALALPTWLGLDGWVPVPEVDTGPKPVTAVGRDGGMPRPADWVDATAAVWEQGDVRVAVTVAALVPPDPAVAAVTGRQQWVLKIGLKLTNVGVARGIEFAGWPTAGPDQPQPRLTTAGGHPLVLRPASAAPEKVTVFPGKSAEVALTFAPPTAADDLRLELPAAPFGGTDPVRFRLSRAMVFGR